MRRFANVFFGRRRLARRADFGSGRARPIKCLKFPGPCLYLKPPVKAAVAAAKADGRTSLTNLYAIVKQSLRSGVILGPGQTRRSTLWQRGDTLKARDTTQLDPDNWVGDYGDALYGFAFTQVKNGAVAEDLVQDTYFAALRSQKSFRGISSEKTWLFGILRHKILDHFRRSQKTRLIDDVSPNPDHLEMFVNAPSRRRSYPANPGSDPEKVYNYKEFLDNLYGCLSNLPQRAAAVFISYEIDGLSTEEICQMFDISKFNCWTILHRARSRLRTQLEHYGFKPST